MGGMTRVGISRNDQLDWMIGIRTHSHFIAIGIEQGQCHGRGQICVGLRSRRAG